MRFHFRISTALTSGATSRYIRSNALWPNPCASNKALVQRSITIKKSAENERDVITPEGGNNGKPKVQVSAVGLPGKARDEQITLWLRQGQSFLDVMSSLERTPQFIAREAKRILGEYEVKKLMKKKKKGQWSDAEIQHLKSLRKRRLPLAEIAMWLRRTKLSVENQLQALQTPSSETEMVEGPQELPPAFQELLFNTRLAEIWQGLLKSQMTQMWREALQQRSTEQWLSSISMGVPEDVKRVLGRLRPPTWEELRSLPLVDTNDAGVYARLVTSNYELQMVRDRYLYVGSASKYGDGLNLRIAQHKMKTKRRHESRLQRDIRTKGLKGSDRFITLMVMGINSSEKEVVLGVRRTVTLAEAIFTMWLNALQSPAHDLQSLCPWDPETLNYMGWSSYNPLMTDIVEPKSEGSLPRGALGV